jgi:hypothetical protein
MSQKERGRLKVMAQLNALPVFAVVVLLREYVGDVAVYHLAKSVPCAIFWKRRRTCGFS